MRSLGKLFQVRTLISALALSACLCIPATAQEDVETVFRPCQPGDETEFNVDSGIMIINGKFVPAPYHIFTLPSGEVQVNGLTVEFKANSPRTQFITHRSRYLHRRGAAVGGDYADRHEYNEDFGASEDQEYNEDTLGSFLYGVLQLRGVLVCQADEPLYWFGSASSVRDFLDTAMNEGGDVSSMPAWLTNALPALRADLAFRRQALNYVRLADDTEISNRAENGKVRLLEQAAYPLSSIGMLLVVLATGQLLSVRPPKREELHLVSSEASSNTVRFAAMIVGFSILDLIWTVLASHDGTMKELNPLGARFITDPMMLVVFKLATTSVSVGILLYMRQHHRITLASWWLCLVLTLLTARWLTFNSLLV